MATIKPIEDRTVHRIQSGQVIVDLCSVVKELVENSLDAGATSIDVRFKNQGLDLIEVQDNGNGITSDNYATVALKHHTSKLSTYDDLTTLMTFGFRGEALSSLCALSKFTVVTCTASDAPKGTKLDFEQSGALKETGIVAAQKGTVVSVESLFYNLPVRRRELERKIKTEWNRVVSVLGQYACIHTGVKFSVTQQSAKGKKTALFATRGNDTTRENLVNVFGAKTLAALIRMDLHLELEATTRPGLKRVGQEGGAINNIRIVGHISRPAYGEGRQTPDRQMFFVNSRPCGLPQVAKAFNEVYKTYNSHQAPFIFANIMMDTHNYDVNVSPDKRTIMLHDQTRMLEELKTALTALFETQDHTVPVSQLTTLKRIPYKQLTISRQDSTRSQRSQDESSQTEQELQQDEETENEVSSYATSTPSRNENAEAEPLAEGIASISEEHQMKTHKQARKSDRDVSFTRNQEMGSTVEGTDPEISAGSLDSSLEAPLHVHNMGTNAEELAMSFMKNQRIVDEPGEEVIPALTSPAKRMLPPSTPFSTYARPRRTVDDVATITIGGHTVTSSIGTPSSTGQKSVKRASAATSSLPSFGSRLSQRFSAAPSTQSTALADDPSDDEESLTQPSQGLFVSDSDNEAGAVFDENGDSESDSHEQSSEEDDDSAPFHESKSVGLDVELSEESDGEYVDDIEKKAREDAKVQDMIKAAEETARVGEDGGSKRASALLKEGIRRKDGTVHLEQSVTTSSKEISILLASVSQSLDKYNPGNAGEDDQDSNSGLNSETAEAKLSLTINKSDFAKMKIVGQFNLGFILATRVGVPGKDDGSGSANEDLFIIDQHASDEKYNFERLQSITTVQSQRLVRPKTLDLTAVEEEIVMENLDALAYNGFIVNVDTSGDEPIGRRCVLVSLPLSRETTFSLKDLEELISLLSEHPSGTIPRPDRVRKMFAMRACRSSIMIGKTLSTRQMETVVRHMGDIDKPWNCPHGRPTMRHLCGLGRWDESGWREGDEFDVNSDGFDSGRVGEVDWGSWAASKRMGA